MARCVFAKAQGSMLVAADYHAEEFVAKMKLGQGMAFDVKLVRNIKFHRKFFSLLNLAFDMWEPDGAKLHRGEPIRKDFEQFRQDILILAGHYEAAYKIDGSVKFTAKSISFGRCDEIEFERIYKAVLDVCWDKIFRERDFRSQQEVENVIGQLLSYGG